MDPELLTNPQLIDEDTIVDLSTSFSKEDFESLLKLLSEFYYNDENIISDRVYDQLIDVYEAKFGEYNTIGAPETDSVVLPYFLPSLKKVRKQSELNLWFKNYQGPYIIEDKIDGLTLLYTKEKGKKSLYTRGDGTKGRNVSHALAYLDLPNIPDGMAVRGEIVLTKESFDRVGTGFKSGRNLAVGVLRSEKNYNPTIAKELKFFAYRIMNQVNSSSEDILKLQKLGFMTPNPVSTSEVSEEILRDYYEGRKQSAPYETDGLVVYHDHAVDWLRDGNPKHAIAFKIENEKAITKVLSIQWRGSKGKLLKPRVYFDSVRLDGADIRAASGYNAKFIVDNNIGPGAMIMITRSGSVIPKIVKVITPAESPDLPEGDYAWNDNGVELVLLKDNSDVKVGKLKHFLETLDIKNFGRRRIETFVEIGIDCIDKLMRVTPEQLADIPGFGSSLINQIIDGIKEKITDVPLEKIMDASNLFPGIGEKRFSMILEVYPNILNTADDVYATAEKIKGIKGFDSLASVISLNLPIFVEWLINNPMITIKDTVRVNDSMAGMIVVFSGFRDKDLEDNVKRFGGKVTTAISKNTNLLVLKDLSPENMKTKAIEAEKKQIKIISREEFLRKYF